MLRTSYILLLCLLFQVCTEQTSNSESDPIYEKDWISINEAPLNSGYYLVNDEIYSFEIEINDTSQIPEFVKKHASHSTPIMGSDSKTFRISMNNDGERYAKDCNYVYYATEESYYESMEYCIVDNKVTVLGADPRTFRYIDKGYGADDSNVYFQGSKITGADPKTFRTLGSYFAVDSGFAYIGGRKIVDADRSSFEYYLFDDSIDMESINLWYSKIKWKKDN